LSSHSIAQGSLLQQKLGNCAIMIAMVTKQDVLWTEFMNIVTVELWGGKVWNNPETGRG
jgi:hypothetical protein